MSRLSALALAALLLGGCASTSEDEDIEVHLQTQAEADATAKSRITPKNADTELDALEAEISGEGAPK